MAVATVEQAVVELDLRIVYTHVEWERDVKAARSRQLNPRQIRHLSNVLQWLERDTHDLRQAIETLRRDTMTPEQRIKYIRKRIREAAKQPRRELDPPPVYDEVYYKALEAMEREE